MYSPTPPLDSTPDEETPEDFTRLTIPQLIDGAKEALFEIKNGRITPDSIRILEEAVSRMERELA